MKSTIWKLLQCKGKRQAVEEVEDHSLNFSRDMRGKEGRAWEATTTGSLISVAQMSSLCGVIT